jgi:hypothetical protein
VATPLARPPHLRLLTPAAAAQIMVDYRPWWRHGGLTLEGLARTYADGVSSAAADHATLGLHLPRPAALPAAATAQAPAAPVAGAAGALQSFPVELSPMKAFGGQVRPAGQHGGVTLPCPATHAQTHTCLFDNKQPLQRAAARRRSDRRAASRLLALAATQARKRSGACAPQGLVSATASAAASPQRSVTSFPVELPSGQSTPARPASRGRPGASPAPAAAGPAAAQAAAALAAADRALANVARPPPAAKSGLGAAAGGAPRDREAVAAPAAAAAAAPDDPASLSTVKTLLDKIASIPPAGVRPVAQRRTPSACVLCLRALHLPLPPQRAPPSA